MKTKSKHKSALNLSMKTNLKSELNKTKQWKMSLLTNPKKNVWPLFSFPIRNIFSVFTCSKLTTRHLFGINFDMWLTWKQILSSPSSFLTSTLSLIFHRPQRNVTNRLSAAKRGNQHFANKKHKLSKPYKIFNNMKPKLKLEYLFIIRKKLFSFTFFFIFPKKERKQINRWNLCRPIADNYCWVRVSNI